MASSTSSFSDKLNAVSDKSTKVLTNDYVLSILSVVAVAYVSTFAPKLPHGVAKSMDNIVVKFLMFFVIAFLVVRKLDVALIASLVVLALVMALQVYSKKENMHNVSNALTSEPAHISVDANGTYTEAAPLGEDWTNKVSKQVYGRKDNQWPTYEDPAKMPEPLSTCTWNGPQMSCGAVSSPSSSDLVSNGSTSSSSTASTVSSVIASNEVHDDESEHAAIQGISPMSSPMASLATV